MNESDVARPTPVDVWDFSTQIADTFAALAEQKQLLLSVDDRRDDKGIVCVDVKKLRRLIENLVGNSLKFTEEGGVTLVIDRCSDVVDDVEWLMISVVATAIGIPQNRLQAVFEPFEQADENTTLTYGGAGLGLTICRTLATQLGGTIQVSSTLGVGTRFDVRIPCEVSQEFDYEFSLPAAGSTVSQSVAQKTDAAEPRIDLRDVRVLVCDDTAVSRDVICQALAGASAETEVAVNGHDAIARAMGGSFDVILMDMQMPVLSGAEAVKTLIQRDCVTPVVALTANAMAGERERCLAAGCVTYLTKPVEFSLLKKTVRDVVDESRRPPTASYDLDVESVRDLFHEELREIIPRLREAVALRDWDHVVTLAHGLGGAAAMVEATQWVPWFRELEAAAKKGDSDEAEGVLARVCELAAESRNGVTGVEV